MNEPIDPKICHSYLKLPLPRTLPSPVLSPFLYFPYAVHGLFNDPNSGSRSGRSHTSQLQTFTASSHKRVSHSRTLQSTQHFIKQRVMRKSSPLRYRLCREGKQERTPARASRPSGFSKTPEAARAPRQKPSTQCGRNGNRGPGHSRWIEPPLTGPRTSIG